MKYIDADKLIAEIKWRLETGRYNIDSKSTLQELLSFIASLQQEQPEVNLEKVLSGFTGYYAHENSGEYPSAIDIARHFYELGLNARKEKTK